jgi:hypothetical protein
METSLPKPTVELVRQKGQEFDREEADIEQGLTALVKLLPHNTAPAQVLLKVAAINQLYATNIFAVRVVAKHITGLRIDADLEDGAIQLVDRIARVTIGDKPRNNLSFASKYCSWHRPEIYPIYDSRARACLKAYSKQFDLSFARNGLWDYDSYVKAVKEFQDRFELWQLTFKEIDKFLYSMGNEIKVNEQARKADKQAPV